ncbi:hypothetical protein EBR16_05275 [bacterium]|nr:hypothetical protein [bacterium]
MDVLDAGVAEDVELLDQRVEHDVGVDVGLHFSARRIALTETGAIDANRAPTVAEQGHKTLFNVLGPLINPARPAAMMVGVYDERWVVPMAAALGELGVRRGLVVHGRAGGGMDELTTAGENRVRGCGELASVDGVWLPGDFGFKACPVADLRGGSPEENLAMFSDLLVGGVPEGLLDTLCLSAGTALWVAGRAADPGAGAKTARELVLGGALREQARRLREAYRVG